MRSVVFLQLLLSLLSFSSPALSISKSQKPPGKNAILLSQVHALTLHGGRLTSSRRVSPIPQLKCVGPSKRICNMYEIDIMRCTNAGFGYDEEDIQWTCTASLPAEFKLGSTDVVCEGYRNADDPWVLKGSCGVEYRMLLTELGERKFGYSSFDDGQWRRQRMPGKFNSIGGRAMNLLGNLIFFGFFIACFLLILWPLVRRCFGLGGNRRAPQAGRRWGGGGGGGDNDDNGGPYPGPPPPYNSSYSYGANMSGQGWRPGFWTGALTGGSLGYGLGRRERRREYGSGENSSSSSSSLSSRTTSTGFGSTSRR